jgi:Domain of unknown function (DUF4349)/Putative zinc-finger
MTQSLQHAFGAEEVMAYLDGALAPDRAAPLAAHLEACGECQETARSFRQLSERLLQFEVESVAQNIDSVVLAALDMKKDSKAVLTSATPWQKLRNVFVSQTRLRSWAIAGAVVMVAITLVGIGIPLLHTRHDDSGEQVTMALSQSAAHEAAPAPPPAGNDGRDLAQKYAYAIQRKQQAALTESLANNFEERQAATTAASYDDSASEQGQLAAPDAQGPMIEMTTSLHIVPTNYDQASAAIEKLAAARGGYVANLTASAQTGQARDLSAELHIPAKQADAFMADLRKLGQVVEETRSSEEVTAQFVDLQARLRASHAAEQRLVELLGTRTGKLSDVLEVERELARVRSEIESMQGQSNVMAHQVAYATMKVELSEEYHETLRTDSSIGSKIRNAAVTGLKNFEDGIVGALVFVLTDGLSIVFWLGLALAVAWFVRKRIRAMRKA